jgi:hypothetical protein
MSRFIKIIFLSIIIILVSASIAFADVIILKNGDVIVGDIISEDETSIVVRTSFGDITINKDEIAEIKKEDAYEKGEIVEVLMYDGSRIRGTVIEDTVDNIKLQTELGLIDIPKSNISNVVVGGTTESGSLGLGIDTGTTGLSEEYYEKLIEYKNNAVFIELFTFKDIDNQKWFIRSSGFILSEVDFLKKIGKNKLASQIEQDINQRNLLYWTFVTSTSLSAILTGVGFYNAYFDGDGADPTNLEIGLMAGGGILTGLSILGIINNLQKEHYLSFAEAKSYANEYNVILRQKLGLSIKDVRLIHGAERNDEYIEDEEYIAANLDDTNKAPIILGGIIPAGLGFNLYLLINF